jgi:DNA-binding transcriptional MocR family regulator
VAELRSGLLDATDAHQSAGLPASQAALAAIREFGDPVQVAVGFRAEIAASLARRVAVTLQWLRPEAGAFCCARLNPDTFGPPGVRRFYDRLAEQRTVIAPGPWFGDSAHVIRIGLAYETDGQLEKGLEVISDALRP